MKTRLNRFANALLALVLAGCQVGPKYHAPSFKAPPRFTDAPAGLNAEPLGAWWRKFNDPVLNRLVDDTIAGNLDIQILHQHIIEARAERDVAGAALYPQVDASAAPSLANSSTTVQWPPGTGVYRTYALGFDSSWELDIFGGIHRAERAGQDNLEGEIEARRGALVSAISDVALDYFALRGTQARIGIAENSLHTAQRLANLTNQEFERGISTSLAVAQAQAQVDTVAAALPTLHAQAGHLVHALAVLAGQLPGSLESTLLIVPDRAQKLPEIFLPVPPPLPASIPSEVIANRPDIRRAERNLAASTERVGAAIAQLYPHFSIPLSAVPTSAYLSELFTAQSLVWSVGLSLTQSVYTGGRLSARIVEAKAAAESDRLTYRNTVLHAFGEVEDALLTYQTENARSRSLAAAVHDNQLALDRAERLFQAGLTDFLNPLNAERSLYGAQDAHVESELARLKALIALDKALGGGWQAAPFSDEAALARR